MPASGSLSLAERQDAPLRPGPVTAPDSKFPEYSQSKRAPTAPARCRTPKRCSVAHLGIHGSGRYLLGRFQGSSWTQANPDHSVPRGQLPAFAQLNRSGASAISKKQLCRNPGLAEGEPARCDCDQKTERII